MCDEEFINLMVSYLKITFIRWRDPPVELPAESIIHDVIQHIILASRERDKKNEFQ